MFVVLSWSLSQKLKNALIAISHFLPFHYFNKVHAKNSEEFSNLFSHVDEINEEDLVKGIHVIW